MFCVSQIYIYYYRFHQIDGNIKMFYFMNIILFIIIYVQNTLLLNLKIQKKCSFTLLFL